VTQHSTAQHTMHNEIYPLHLTHHQSEQWAAVVSARGAVLEDDAMLSASQWQPGSWWIQTWGLLDRSPLPLVGGFEPGAFRTEVRLLGHHFFLLYL